MAQKWHKLLKSTLKVCKPKLNKLMLAAIWMHQLYSDERFKPLTNSGRSLTWAYKLKILKSSSQISATSWLKIS